MGMLVLRCWIAVFLGCCASLLGMLAGISSVESINAIVRKTSRYTPESWCSFLPAGIGASHRLNSAFSVAGLERSRDFKGRAKPTVNASVLDFETPAL